MNPQIVRLFQEAENLHRKGQLGAAKKRYELILQKQPDFAHARLFLAVVLQQAGQIQDAVNQARRAIQDMDPPDAVLLTNYGVIMKNAGLLQEAEKVYQEALNLNPNMPAARSNLATLQLVGGKLDLAEQSFTELTRQMEEPGPWLNLARIALAKEDPEKASQCLIQAEDIAPKHPDIYFLRGKVSATEKDDESVFRHLKTALNLQAAHGESWQLLQSLDPEVLDLEFVDKAAAGLAETGVQDAILLATAVDICRKNMIWGSLPRLETLLGKALENPLDTAPGISATFTLLGANVPQKAHLKAAEITWQKMSEHVKPVPERQLQARTKDKKIRVGFLSSDLRGHAVGYLIVGLLESLPHENIEWYAYNNSFSDQSDSRDRIKTGVDRFVNIASLNNPELAARIYQDEIDILIDLNGMTRETRVSVMAYKPAPV
ncbi:tetratricopeptide repeat protein [Desulfonatronovibrio magnus]|uniref:tetratricopeptide repeat protein n=1 Tax=Desulfonatronovibrio magnus TaxID=698827 RepID=UPI0006978901|nr:tetratricopeptide repeat protein [Desulfonatronovibrio magnus]